MACRNAYEPKNMIEEADVAQTSISEPVVANTVDRLLFGIDNWVSYAPSAITRSEIAVWQYGVDCHPIEGDMGKVVTFNLNLVGNEQVVIDKMF